MPNFSSENKGTWFPFDLDDETAGGITLRELAPDELTRIDKIVTKHKRKVVAGVLSNIETRDEKLASRLTWDYCIVDWKNVQLDDKQLDCTTDNKVKLMAVLDFAKFVADQISDLVEINETLRETTVKNL
ncbi:hypothetical protein KAR91_08840 [Candidatus Pacearchaeota archaeon]|nr:hypothetical protein [Candidatus Pacearchaeota archaeon]